MPAGVRATRTAAVAAAALVTLLAACSSSPSPSTSGPSPSPTPTPTASSASPTASPSGTSASPSATSASPTPTTTVLGFTTRPVSGGTAYTAPAQAHLRRVAVGSRSGYDRLVLDFGTDPVPRFTITPQTTSSFRTDPADVLVTLLGTSGVRVVVSDTVKNAKVAERLVPLYPAIREVRAIGEFEAVVSYGVGVRGSAWIRVTTLTGPYRLVVDVAWTA